MSDNKPKTLLDYFDKDIRQHQIVMAAFTHSSAGRKYNNERLEFFGDAVLGFLIAKLLYQRFENAKEGTLTRWRAYLVRRETLAELARELNISEMLIIGRGEENSGGRQKESILADALEAFIGALYGLRGEQETESFVSDIYSTRLEQLLSLGDLKDAKTRLQEMLQKAKCPLPMYTLSKSQPGKPFNVQCRLDVWGIEAEGKGTSKLRAEQNAAAKVLEMIANTTADA